MLIKKVYKKIKSLRNNPKGFANMKITRLLPSSVFIRLIYAYKLGKQPNLKNPQTFNDKLQWMKLHYRNPLYKNLTDKYKVREYVSKTVGEKYLIPLIGIYDSVDKIDFDALPNQFVLKCNHDSGSIVICENKKSFDIQKAKDKLNYCLNRDYYYLSREWQYKNIEPKIICEKYMVDEAENDLKDYKFFCFDGRPKIIQVDFGRFSNHKRNIYDIEWNYLNVEISHPSDPNVKIEKPENFNEMLQIVAKLSSGFPHVRVDLYNTRQRIYFGEMTFCHQGGNGSFNPEEFNYKMGCWLNLPCKNA